MSTHYCRVGKIIPTIEKDKELDEVIRTWSKDEDSNEDNPSEVLG